MPKITKEDGSAWVTTDDEISRPRYTRMTVPTPGMRDFFPEEMSQRDVIFEKLKTVVESFGYRHYDGPVLEPFSLYAAKTSEEVVKGQTYQLVDRGGRELVLRPEMTPTAARMIASDRNMKFPQRWYATPNLFRYERKQRGRYREHWQLNVDLFGSASHDAEIEVLEVLCECLFALGAKTEDFVVRVNDRNLAALVFERFVGIQPQKILSVFRALDGMRKVSLTVTEERLVKGGLSVAEAVRVIELVEMSTENFEVFAGISSKLNVIQMMHDGFSASRPVNLKFDLSLVRGFDYYTGTVFEVYDTDYRNPRSIAGGGRYDRLTALYGGPDVPGVGFGMGDVVLWDFLEVRGLLPQVNALVDGVVVVPGESSHEERQRARDIARTLRRAGWRISMALEGEKVGKVLERASKENVKFVIFCGSEEAKRNTVKFRCMKLREKSEMRVVEIRVECLSSRKFIEAIL